MLHIDSTENIAIKPLEDDASYSIFVQLYQKNIQLEKYHCHVFHQVQTDTYIATYVCSQEKAAYHKLTFQEIKNKNQIIMTQVENYWLAYNYQI